MTYLFLAGMLVLGLLVPRWWTVGIAIGIAIVLAWLFDATQLHPHLESSLRVLAYTVSAAAAGVAAAGGVVARRLGRPR